MAGQRGNFISDFLFVLLMAVYAIGGALFLLTIGADSLAGNHPFQFFADSNTYLATYAGEAHNFDGALVGVNSNYLGPLFLLRLLGGNIYLVMVVNMTLFTASILWIARQLKLNPLVVGLLLCVSPITFSSLMAINKEIFIYPLLAFALAGFSRERLWYLLIALVLSILVRWQLTLFLLLLIAMYYAPLLPGRKSTVSLLLLGISAMYLAIGELIEPILAYVENSISTYDAGGSGVFELLLEWQNKGMYFLVFPLKALHLLFSMGLKLDRVFWPVEIYNDFFIGGHCAVTLLLFFVMLKQRRFTLSHDLVFVSIVFLAIFCITPVYAPRYLYPVFVLWVLVVLGAPGSLQFRSRRQMRGHSPQARPIVLEP